MLLAVAVAIAAAGAVGLLTRRSEPPPSVGALAAGALAFAGALLAAPRLGLSEPGYGPALSAGALGLGVALLVGQIVLTRRYWTEKAGALERWNRRFDALLARGSVWAAWLSGSRVRWVSPALADALARPPEALAGLSIEELFSEGDVQRLRRRARSSRASGKPWQAELRRPGGAENLPVEVTAVLRPRDVDGAPGWGFVLRDLRDTLRARAAAGRRRRLEHLLGAVSTELLRAESRDLEPAIERALGLLGEYAQADRASTRVLDDQDPKLVRRCQLWVADGCDRERSPDQLSVADAPSLLPRLRAGEVVWIPDARYSDEPGQDGRDLLSRASVRKAVVFPLRVEGELFGGCVLAWERGDCPLTEQDTQVLRLAADALGSALARQRAARALRRQDELLLQAQRMEAVGALAGGIAHDFNNLLTVIHGYAETLRNSGRLDEEQRRQVEQIARAGERAAALTSRLLAFGRRQRREPRNIDLGERVETLEPILRRSLGESIELSIEREPGLPPVHADPAQLDQVVLNLVLNARDAVAGRGTIGLRLHTVPDGAGRAVCLEVADDGCGIPPEHRDRIFEPFFTTKAVGQGTGLGLAMVHGIVHQSGGSIEVESEPDAGTVFRVKLPIAEGALADPITPLPPARHPRGGRGRILLVEDEQAVRDLAVYTLRSAGFAVLAAADGEEGLKLAQEDARGFDAIVTDVVMPKRSGPEMVALLPSRYRGVPVVYISGYHQPGLEGTAATDAASAAPSRTFEKPFTPQQLVDELSALLGA
jgi:signal transduction histidine kinase